MHATPKEKQWEQNVTMVDEYSRIEVAASIVKSEGESVTMPTVIPGKGCCGGKVAEEEEPVIVTNWEATVLRDEMNGRDRAAILEERNQSGAGIKDDP